MSSAREPPSLAEDRDLGRRCVLGDPAAQRALVDRHVSLVFSLCRRRGLSGADAEDVSQEVFLDLFRALPRYRGEARLATLIFTLAERRIVDYRRSPQRRHEPAGVPDDETFPKLGASAAPSPEAAALRESDESRLRVTLAGLGEPGRTVLMAYYLGEMPVADIARMLRMPEGTVKTHLHRGRIALRERMEV